LLHFTTEVRNINLKLKFHPTIRLSITRFLSAVESGSESTSRSF